MIIFNSSDEEGKYKIKLSFSSLSDYKHFEKIILLEMKDPSDLNISATLEATANAVNSVLWKKSQELEEALKTIKNLESEIEHLKNKESKINEEINIHKTMSWCGKQGNECSACGCVIDGENLELKFDFCPKCGRHNSIGMVSETISGFISNIFAKNKGKEMQYADIYEMFDCVIEWLEKFYLGDDCYFEVSKTGARLIRHGGLTIPHKSYRNRIYPKENNNVPKSTE